MTTSYKYEHTVVDPITKGNYVLRTRRPKIKDQIQFHIRVLVSGRARVKPDEKMVLYARD
jgi:hypothetical protein